MYYKQYALFFSSEILCPTAYRKWQNFHFGGKYFFKGNDGSSWWKMAQEQGFPSGMLQKRDARWVSLTLALQKTSPTTAQSVPLQQWKETVHVCVCVHMHETHNRFLTCKKQEDKKKQKEETTVWVEMRGRKWGFLYSDKIKFHTLNSLFLLVCFFCIINAFHVPVRALQ